MNYAQCGISKTRRPIKRGRLYTRRRIERTGADMAWQWRRQSYGESR